MCFEYLIFHCRFISPAIVTPETVDVAIPPDPTIRRGLMVIAKIIQNLANNILFGKEAHMVILNDFLKDNIVTVNKFLSEINVCRFTLIWRLYAKLFRRNPYLLALRMRRMSGWSAVTTIPTQSFSTASLSGMLTRLERNSSVHRRFLLRR